MKSIRRVAIVAASVCLAFATPSQAQDSYPLEDGDYVEVAGVMIEDGHALDYANHIAGMWKRGQDFAVSQGWITSYEVLGNVHPRKGEPDVYLITRFAKFADAAEDDRRDKAYRAHMQRTIAQLQSESGERAKIRTLGSTMLLRELKIKK